MDGNSPEGDHKPEIVGGPDVHQDAPKTKIGSGRIRNFACPNCGASVTVRYPGLSMSASCESCHSLIDVTNQNYKILSAYFAKTSLWTPRIPLGSRGVLKDRLWEVIGYMARREGIWSGDYWEEYLLFNPYYGYRWLVCDGGHWNFVTTIKDKPETRKGSALSMRATLNEKDYRIYSHGDVKVVYVVGEFYWRVVIDSQVEATDYICPPEMLSREKDSSEVVWSLGVYMPPEEIEKSFNLKPPLSKPNQVGPNQPSANTLEWKKIKVLYLIFAGLLSIFQMISVTSASNKIVFSAPVSFTPGVKISDVTTPVFTLEKDLANVKIEFEAPVDNSWVYVAGDLVNNANGTTYSFERSIEYYHGYDSDGAWSEGSSSSSLVLSSIPAGQYYINLDSESGDFGSTTSRSFQIRVLRDVSIFSNYFWCLIYLSIIPGLAWAMAHGDEVSRWSKSEFSPYKSSGG